MPLGEKKGRERETEKEREERGLETAEGAWLLSVSPVGFFYRKQLEILYQDFA